MAQEPAHGVLDVGTDHVGRSKHDGLQLGVTVHVHDRLVVELDGVSDLGEPGARAQGVAFVDGCVVQRIGAVDVERGQNHHAPCPVLEAHRRDPLAADDIQIEAQPRALLQVAHPAEMQHHRRPMPSEGFFDPGLVVARAVDGDTVGKPIANRHRSIVDADDAMPLLAQRPRNRLGQRPGDPGYEHDLGVHQNTDVRRASPSLIIVWIRSRTFSTLRSMTSSSSSNGPSKCMGSPK